MWEERTFVWRKTNSELIKSSFLKPNWNRQDHFYPWKQDLHSAIPLHSTTRKTIHKKKTPREGKDRKEKIEKINQSFGIQNLALSCCPLCRLSRLPFDCINQPGFFARFRRNKTPRYPWMSVWRSTFWASDERHVTKCCFSSPYKTIEFI